MITFLTFLKKANIFFLLLVLKRNYIEGPYQFLFPKYEGFIFPKILFLKILVFRLTRDRVVCPVRMKQFYHSVRKKLKKGYEIRMSKFLSILNTFFGCISRFFKDLPKKDVIGGQKQILGEWYFENHNFKCIFINGHAFAGLNLP